MSVKRYQPAPFNERVLHATKDGECVKYEDYAALEARCAALAAENACLKQSIEEVAEAFETGTDGALAAAVDESLNLLTPETDAVLKRIQAQGVAMFASKCKEESKRAHSSDARDSWWVSGENADDFAAQLRKERE
ncbi:hypothetical protein JK156_22305 [Enterobacter ludwigii]|uniref:hypothetical protein n=1 Tax=Enterobacter ludwigii TaxID=299767 RepID=UPI001BA6C043|nr:hypothetical protein [Enterobacter ludwigii]MBS0870705.1 hypothetical protein [Enterobacter ludwigii]